MGEYPGLTSAEAASILARVGPNTLPTARGVPLWRHATRQFAHFFAVMLWVAAGLSLVAGMPQLAAAIVLVIVINGTFSFVQEYRAERAADRLRHLLPLRARVRRDGTTLMVDAITVVPGDVVLLEEGDRIPADMTCRAAAALQVDTSSLTGESVPEHPVPGDSLFGGTYVVRGTATATVSATGGATEFARIARMSAARHRPPTPLERDIRHLVLRLGGIAVIVGIVFTAVMSVLGAPLSSAVVFGVGVIVALVPEGLLPTVTLSLAIGAQRMAREQALVRRLESVETLGATTVICTDKTGTLTQNRMNVVAVWTPAGRVAVEGPGYAPQAVVRADSPDAIPPLHDVARAARLCSEGRVRLGADGQWLAEGDPMDAAVDTLAHRLHLPDARPQHQYLPFDPERLTTEALLPDRVLVKGAPEAVFRRCVAVPPPAHQALADYTAGGRRVLAVAAGADPDALTLLGLLAFQDPPREGVREAIADCRRAGIRLAMVTGDHPRTARAIATQIGLGLPSSPVLVGGSLPDDPVELARLAAVDGAVFARITPEEKLAIAQALRARGDVVAMTGDGVNDAPALTEADIGVAMGQTGTDVAREAADLVLLDDHFATIVSAVRQGRGTFRNARKFLTYHLSANVAELVPFLVWAVSAGTFPLALGVLQILFIDIGADTVTAIALGATPPSPRTLEHPPVSGALLDRTVAVRAFGVLGPWEAATEMSVFVVALALGGWFPTSATTALATASGGAYLSVIVCQMANAFACRSTSRPAWHHTPGGNRFLIAAVLFSLTFGCITLVVPVVATALGQAWPPWAVLPVMAAGAVGLVLLDSAVKHGSARRSGPVGVVPA